MCERVRFCRRLCIIKSQAGGLEGAVNELTSCSHHGEIYLTCLLNKDSLCMDEWLNHNNA